MPAKQLNITLEQGAAFVINITWQSAEGTPVDLTGYTAKMQARYKYSDPAPLVTFSTADGTITLGGVLGTVKVEGMALLPGLTEKRSGVYDLELTKTSDGLVTRLLQGSAVFSPEVTK